MKYGVLLLVSLLLAGPAWAQSAAPLAWGEARWLEMTGCSGRSDWQPLVIKPWGDTLVAYAVDGGGGGSDSDWVCTSTDDGRTHSPWLPLAGDGSITTVNFTCTFASSHNRIYAFVERGTSSTTDTWVRLSSDYGLTWSPPQQSVTGYRGVGYAVGAEVYRSYASAVALPSCCQAFQSSSDGGLSWTLPVVFDTAYYNPETILRPLACTRTRVLLATYPGNVNPWPPERLERVHVAHGPRHGNTLSLFQPIPDWPLRTAPSHLALAADTGSETAIVLEMRGDRLTMRDYLQPVLHRTTDGGDTWEPYISLSNEEWVSELALHPANFCHGKLWVLAYQYCDPVTPEIFIHVWFSANRGKSWYPVSNTGADSALDVVTMMGQVTGNELRLYWTQICGYVSGWPVYDFRTVAGVLTADTLPPVLSAPVVLPDTVALGETLAFAVDVQENDTLYEVALRLWTETGLDTLVRLVRQDSCRWQGSFVIADSGHYRYRYEAEDFWEQRTLWPDSDGLALVVPEVADAVDEAEDGAGEVGARGVAESVQQRGGVAVCAAACRTRGVGRV